MSLARQVWHVELEGDGEVGGDRCTTLLYNPAQNDWVVISRAEDSGNGVGVCPGDGCVVMQVAGVKGCGGINNAADGEALGAAQNLSELECDVGEARLDGYREDPPCRGAVAFNTNASSGTWTMKTTGPGRNEPELPVIELACEALH